MQFRRLFIRNWLKETKTPCFWHEPKTPAQGKENTRFIIQRWLLIFEEMAEYAYASSEGLSSGACIVDRDSPIVRIATQTMLSTFRKCDAARPKEHRKPQGWREARTEMLDALGDIMWICMGTCEAMGVSYEELLDRIADSNATKLIDRPIEVSEDGTITKQAHYRAPNFTDLVY